MYFINERYWLHKMRLNKDGKFLVVSFAIWYITICRELENQCIPGCCYLIISKNVIGINTPMSWWTTLELKHFLCLSLHRCCLARRVFSAVLFLIIFHFQHVLYFVWIPWQWSSFFYYLSHPSPAKQGQTNEIPDSMLCWDAAWPADLWTPD